MHPQTSNNIMRTKSIKQNKINVVTLGCSKNVYDSEVLMGQLKASGKEVVHEDKGNIVVINTCGFINNAKEESINTILEYIQKKEAVYRSAISLICRKKSPMWINISVLLNSLLCSKYWELTISMNL